MSDTDTDTHNPKRIKLSNTTISTLDRPITPPHPAPKSKQPIRSPIQLTHIRDLPASHNIDTVRLQEIFGDPLIRECWQFNYLFDVDFLMSQFDEDVRSLVRVKVVHGSWKREAPNRVRIDEACTRYPNVEAVIAYMPEAFGTHHSKMMVLLRHDDLAQVVIHTANMIPGDWTNMTQAVWRSPLLPLGETPAPDTGPGSGARFKRDLLAYLRAYGPKTGALADQLRRYDFSRVRAALVASVPCKLNMEGLDAEQRTVWGWPGLRDVVRRIPCVGGAPHVVAQMSSVASLGQTDKWLRVFLDALAPAPCTMSIVFPTDDEIRRSLNGYGSGGSIHMKVQSAAQQRQLQYMRPYLAHWAGDRESDAGKQDAGRRRAAPHVKSYIRFCDEKMDSVDWAMVTSANLSTQAWGAAVNAAGEVRICSYEIGVVVWPQLYSAAAMVPTFKADCPPSTTDSVDGVIGLRMPYDLPLTPYKEDDAPWCATASHTEPDWLGQTWTV